MGGGCQNHLRTRQDPLSKLDAQLQSEQKVWLNGPWKFMVTYNVGPPSDVGWFINPMNTIVIGTINHSYWSYVHQLSYRKRGPTLYVYIYPL